MRTLALLLACAGCLGAQRPFVTLPARTVEVTDTATGIPVVVRIGSFAISPVEVTQAEYTRDTGENPSFNKGDSYPVENVTWWDAIRYANRRSIREGLNPCYDLSTGTCDRARNGYRLPTDAEWDYAAGKVKPGDDSKAFAHLGPAGTKESAPLLEWARTQRTRAVASLKPNEHGLYDVFGNVWEWVEDFQDPSGAVAAAWNPAGPSIGVARVIRGGSYMSTSSRWSRGYRSSMEPDRRSSYTGFRLCRTVEMKPEGPAASWFEPYQAVPAAFAKQTGALAPLQASEWKARRNEVHKKWADLLGRPATPRPLVSAREVATHHEPTYTGKLMYLRVEPDYEEKIYLMLPTGPITQALPVVVVPFYDVDSPVGRAMGGRNFSPPGVRSYAHLAVQQGFAAVAIRWFGESYGENYAEAVANLKQRHPQLTGLGKWVWDSQRLLDYLEKIPQIDARRIGMMGHSLGGKMTLYATAMDERIRVAVSSEPGIGLSFSNYEDFWYLGERIRDLPSGSDHHELLALIAPRPFLLIGGDSADNDKSWHYINAAKPVYALFTKPEHIAYVNHRKGHSPTPEAVKLSMEWLRRFLSDPSSQP